MQQNKINRQAGNVFIIIMVGIFLFGSLIYLFTRSAQKGTGNLTKQQSQIAAQEILNYARSLENAVNRVRQNGCSENDISFENDVIENYENSNSPTDPNRCHIFDENGGQLTYQSPSRNWIGSEQEWQFNANFQITGVGNTCNNASCADLNMHLEDVTDEICRHINQYVGIGSTIPVDSIYEFTPYTGSFEVSPNDLADETLSSDLEEKTTGCVLASNRNYFYHVLIVR